MFSNYSNCIQWGLLGYSCEFLIELTFFDSNEYFQIWIIFPSHLFITLSFSKCTSYSGFHFLRTGMRGMYAKCYSVREAQICVTNPCWLNWSHGFRSLNIHNVNEGYVMSNYITDLCEREIRTEPGYDDLTWQLRRLGPTIIDISTNREKNKMNSKTLERPSKGEMNPKLKQIWSFTWPQKNGSNFIKGPLKFCYLT